MDLRFVYSRQLSLLGSYMGTMGDFHEVMNGVLAIAMFCDFSSFQSLRIA